MSGFIDALAWASEAFANQKMLLEHSIGFHNDALHVFAGAAIQIAAAFILRRTLADLLPVGAVVILELGNEANDLLAAIWPIPAMQLGEAIKDMFLTVALPMVLFCLARWYPRLLSDRPA